MKKARKKFAETLDKTESVCYNNILHYNCSEYARFCLAYVTSELTLGVYCIVLQVDFCYSDCGIFSLMKLYLYLFCVFHRQSVPVYLLYHVLRRL